MERQVARYYELKQVQKQIEEELEGLRREILTMFPEPREMEAGPYLLKVAFQERRDYDDNRLYNVLPEASLWRLLSKADPSKISGMVKVNVINEEILDGTYVIRQIPNVRVTKK